MNFFKVWIEIVLSILSVASGDSSLHYWPPLTCSNLAHVWGASSEECPWSGYRSENSVLTFWKHFHFPKKFIYNLENLSWISTLGLVSLSSQIQITCCFFQHPCLSLVKERKKQKSLKIQTIIPDHRIPILLLRSETTKFNLKSSQPILFLK